MHMNVTVFGATGGIGSQVVGQLRSRGHTVIAYVRNPGKVPGTWGEDVMVVVGELSDPAAIDRAVQGADAVVSALGPSLSRKVTGLPLIEGTRNIVAAMQRHGIRRYVGNGTPSVLDPRERPTWQTRLSALMAKTLLRRAYDELTGMSQIVMTSGLDWTIVRFLAPKDGPRADDCGRGSTATTGSGSASPVPTSRPSPPRRSTTPATSAPLLPSATDQPAGPSSSTNQTAGT
jgi:nucleoside-diphosphate-sugar epimerase